MNRDCAGLLAAYLDARLMAQRLWGLAFLLGLVGTSVGLQAQRLHFFCSEIELSHPVWMRL